MPAPFVDALCGYRSGRANTSDAHDALSVELGRLLFERIGVSEEAPAVAAVDKAMARELVSDLRTRLGTHGCDLEVKADQPLFAFEQFAHLSVVAQLLREGPAEVTRAVSRLEAFVRKRLTRPPRHLARLDQLLTDLGSAVAADAERRRRLVEQLGEESLLKVDVTASRRPAAGTTPGELPHLVAGLSLKWSLRTDRAQDCRSQGAKMAALRRGRMPHFAAVTMEPRPAMLAILGRGSGDLDCVYHLHLPALVDAVETAAEGRPARRGMRDNLRRLVDQRRVRDYDDLAGYVVGL